MAHAHAHINPAMLRWARDRVGLDVNEAATAAGVKPDQFMRWEEGEAQPTFRQAQVIAQALHTPFGFFFLNEAPAEDLPLPDLRTVGGAPAGRPSVNLAETVRHALQRQAWFVEYQQEQGAEPLPFVGRFTTASNPVQVARDIRAVLGVDVERGQRKWDVYYRELIEAAERVGVLVMRSGIVGNNTHRKLDVGEFRGFAISHPLAPVVFINSSDAPSARLFTLLHELAHIWLGSSGISNAAPGNTRREEIACNAVAGEFLAPSEVFGPLWAAASQDLTTRIAELAQRFHVSRFVVIRRALDLGLIDRDTYTAFYRAELDAFQAADGGGGSFYRNAGAKNSARFARAVIAEAFSGRLLLRDAGRLLGVQPSKIRDFAGQLGA
jgi:Zn-dependent peptidase ImmA (M78 family)/DNA-binding XRE family transcriptional regulator